MNDMIRMQISAFVDGELPDSESELLLRRLCQDAELRQVVASYMEIGRNLRRDVEVPGMVQLRYRVAEELGAEPYAEGPVLKPLGNRFVRPLTGFAVAATVAALAIFSLQQTNVPSADDETVADNSGYTQPPADNRLDEMFRLHESASGNVGSNAILAEFVMLDINEDVLVKVEPKAVLVAPIEIDRQFDEGESETDIDEMNLQAD
jgi:Anti sigma-E protein RseA, N-terminal domain